MADMVMEYRVGMEFDLEALEQKVNTLAREGWAMKLAYGVPNSGRSMHVVWMWRYVPAETAGSVSG